MNGFPPVDDSPLVAFKTRLVFTDIVLEKKQERCAFVAESEASMSEHSAAPKRFNSHLQHNLRKCSHNNRKSPTCIWVRIAGHAFIVIVAVTSVKIVELKAMDPCNKSRSFNKFGGILGNEIMVMAEFRVEI